MRKLPLHLLSLLFVIALGYILFLIMAFLLNIVLIQPVLTLLLEPLVSHILQSSFIFPSYFAIQLAVSIVDASILACSIIAAAALWNRYRSPLPIVDAKHLCWLTACLWVFHIPVTFLLSKDFFLLFAFAGGADSILAPILRLPYMTEFWIFVIVPFLDHLPFEYIYMLSHITTFTAIAAGLYLGNRFSERSKLKAQQRHGESKLYPFSVVKV